VGVWHLNSALGEIRYLDIVAISITASANKEILLHDGIGNEYQGPVAFECGVGFHCLYCRIRLELDIVMWIRFSVTEISSMLRQIILKSPWRLYM
jgi:hypothetical protein